MENSKAKLLFQYRPDENDNMEGYFRYTWDYWGFVEFANEDKFRRNYPTYLILNVKDYL